jgi:hypothetical protein
MKLRTVLAAGIFSLVGTALHAEEFQFTLNGTTDCFFGTTCSPAMTGPTTITFDMNTLDGMASYNPEPYPPPSTGSNRISGERHDNELPGDS